MEKPKPPILEDFDLTEDEISSVPRLLNQKLTREINSKVGLVLGLLVGIGALWGMFVKTASLAYGVFFGVLVGFVVFLMISFLGSLFIEIFVNLISFIQRIVYGRFDRKARRVYRFLDAQRNFDKAMLEYEKYRQRKI